MERDGPWSGCQPWFCGETWESRKPCRFQLAIPYSKIHYRLKQPRDSRDRRETIEAIPKMSAHEVVSRWQQGKASERAQ